eukprot:6811362-Pyramimonas_sp.AAC.1
MSSIESGAVRRPLQRVSWGHLDTAMATFWAALGPSGPCWGSLGAALKPFEGTYELCGALPK